MWTRIFKRWDVGYVNQPLAFYRVHRGEAGSIFRKAAPRDLARYRRKQIEEMLGDPEIGAAASSCAGGRFARHHYTVAMQAFDVRRPNWYGRWQRCGRSCRRRAESRGRLAARARSSRQPSR